MVREGGEGGGGGGRDAQERQIWRYLTTVSLDSCLKYWDVKLASCPVGWV